MEKDSIEWEKVKLGLLGDFFKGSGITKNDLVQNGLPCIRYAELYTKFDFIIPFCISFISEDTAKTAKPIRKGDILFAGSGETKEEIGKCAVYMGYVQAYAGGDNIIFRTSKAIPLYLSFFLNTLGRKQLNKLGQGDSIVHIHSSDLKNVVIPLPPLCEQEKIAEILGTWDLAIEKLTALIEQKKLLKKGLMQRLLTGKQRLSGFSEPWKKKKLGEIADLYQPKTISQSDLSEQGYPVYGANGFIGYYPEFNHKNWQIMITCRGSTCGTVNRTYGPSWITGNAMVINVDKNKQIDKKFLFYCLLKDNFSSIISGSGQPQIVRNPLAKWKIFLPPLPEQGKIANILSKADEEIDLLTRKLSALKEQKTGLMQKLLTGQIRVKVA